MLLTSYDPFTREFDRLAQRVFGTTNGGAQSRRSVIPMDSIRRKDEVELRFDLPGIDPGSIEVTVDKGVLTSWVLDLRSARQLSLQSTGNASRGLSSQPSPSTTNLHMEPGTQSKEAMIKSIKKGLLITDFIGHG